MSLQSAADVPLLISSPNSSSERRISPAWTIAYLKTRLEPITGIPAACQQLSLRLASQDPVALVAADEDHTQLAAFPLQPYAEISVSASSPSHCIATASPVLDPFDMLSSRRLPHLLALPLPRLDSLLPLKLLYLLGTCMYCVFSPPIRCCLWPHILPCPAMHTPSLSAWQSRENPSFGSSAVVCPLVSTEPFGMR